MTRINRPDPIIDPTKPVPDGPPPPGSVALGDGRRPTPTTMDGVTKLGDPSRPAPPTMAYQPPAAAPAPVAGGVKAGWEDIGNNLVRNAATGQVVDQNHPVYTQSGGGAPAGGGGGPAPTTAGGAITSAGGVTNTAANVGGSTPQGAPTTVAQSFQQALINRLNPGAVSADNPAVAGSIQANKLAEQRGFERNRNLLAERAAQTGTNNSGGFESQLLGLAQDRSGREAAFEGQALNDLARQQSGELSGALALGGSLLGDQERLAAQDRLAQLDAQLRREGLGAQTALGNRDIDLRGRLGEGQLNLGLLQALMSNDQFGRSLGQNASQFGQSLDTQTILGLLGGL